jgi:hypothetical protein
MTITFLFSRKNLFYIIGTFRKKVSTTVTRHMATSSIFFDILGAFRTFFNLNFSKYIIIVKKVFTKLCFVMIKICLSYFYKIKFIFTFMANISSGIWEVIFVINLVEFLIGTKFILVILEILNIFGNKLFNKFIYFFFLYKKLFYLIEFERGLTIFTWTNNFGLNIDIFDFIFIISRNTFSTKHVAAIFSYL